MRVVRRVVAVLARATIRRTPRHRVGALSLLDYRIRKGGMEFDYEYFKREILKMTHIDLNCYKEKQMKRRIDSLIANHKIAGYEKYIQALRTDTALFEEFVSYITINVSEFYRNPEQWDYMDKEVFPYLFSKFGRRIKIWSAACSTGDEPYSLVMALSRYVPLSRISVYATDLDKQILAKAKVGLYSRCAGGP